MPESIFDTYIEGCRRGLTKSELSESMRVLAQAVLETDKPGTLSLTITMRPNGSGRVKVSDRISLKVPEFDRADSVFFILENGVPSRRDPSQLSLKELNEMEKSV